MKKYYLIGVFTTAALMCAAVETVWACNDYDYHGTYPFNNPPYPQGDKYMYRNGREYLPVGDPADPFLDPLLMRHSLYFDKGVPTVSGGTLTFPQAGLSGTPGSVNHGNFVIGHKDACGNTGASFIQTINGGANVNVSANATLTFGAPASRVNNNGGKVTQVPSGENVYPVRPKFPDLRKEHFKFPDTAKDLSVSNKTLTLEPGVHYFTKITISDGTLNVKVKNDKNARTIIYVKGEIRNGDGSSATINTVDESGKIIPFSCVGDKGGQVLFIVGGCFMLNRGDKPVDITASIITLGIISINPSAKIKGQVIADELNAFAGIDLANNIKFAPVSTYGVEFSPLTFYDDKHWAWGTSNWTDNGGEPKYYNFVDSHGRPYPANAAEIYRYAANKNKDYDTSIVVSLSDPIKEGSITLPWSVPYVKNAVEPLNASAHRNASVFVDGNPTDDGIGGELFFTPDKDKDTIRLRIIDLDYYRKDLKFSLTFGAAKYTGNNKILPIPQTITLISDDPKTTPPPVEPPLPPEPPVEPPLPPLPPVEPPLPPEPETKTIDFNIKSAAYFDTSSIADGYIDLIKVEFEFDFDSYGEFTFDDFIPDVKKFFVKDFNEFFELPQSRMFNDLTLNDIKEVKRGTLEISVSQDKDKAEVKTFVDNEDKLVMDYFHKFNDTLQINAHANLKINDSVAPIITKAEFKPMSVKCDTKDEDITDTLYIHFSEPLQKKSVFSRDAIMIEQSNALFDFGDVYAAGEAIVKIEIKGMRALPVKNDLIRIEGLSFNGITDAAGISQENTTVWAPLYVSSPESPYDISVYPNPYKVNASKGLDVVVKPCKNRGNLENNLYGKITILDALGNKIVNGETLVEKNGVLLWTWYGKNSYGRTVGAGTYLAIITITGETNEEPETRLQMIGIKK